MKNQIKIIVFFTIFCNCFVVKSQNEQFPDFIDNFTNDSLFQTSRVVFPLPYITWNLEEDKQDTLYITKNKYKFNPLYYSLMRCGEAYPTLYDNFDCKFRDTGEMVFRWIGFTDMDNRYNFKRIEGKWYLVMIYSNDPLE